MKYKDMTPEQKRAHLDRVADWAKRNPKAIAKIQKRYSAKNPFNAAKHRLRRYGVTAEQFNDMLVAQDGRCAICGTDKHGARDWHLDHCHATGKPRGILCVRCNGGLGLFSDNPMLLTNAIQYLRKATLAELL